MPEILSIPQGVIDVIPSRVLVVDSMDGHGTRTLNLCVVREENPKGVFIVGGNGRLTPASRWLAQGILKKLRGEVDPPPQIKGEMKGAPATPEAADEQF